MSRKRKVIGTIGLIFLLVLSFDIQPFLAKSTSNSDKSTIAGFEIESLNREETISLLNSKISEWKLQPVFIKGTEVELTLLPEWFTFNVEATVDNYLAQTYKGIAFWKEIPPVHIPLQFTLSGEVTNLIENQSNLDVEKTLEEIKEKIGFLSSEPIESVPIDLSLLPLERNAFSLENVEINTTSLNDIISALNEQVIGSGKVFSLNEKVNEITVGASFETMNFVASVLYSVVLQTEFDILERHSQGKIPPYMEPGIEAEISNAKDLKFKNTTEQPVSLKVSLKNNALLVEIYAVPTETEGKYQVRESQEIKPRTIYRYSSDLAPGEEELIEEGKLGLRVAVYRTISDKVGPYEKEELISQDYYPPVNRVVLKSAKAPESTVVQDPDLNIDLNGDGLPDMNPSNSSVSGEPTSTTSQPTTEENSDELPEGSYYDKAGNIINGSK